MRGGKGEGKVSKSVGVAVEEMGMGFSVVLGILDVFGSGCGSVSWA